MTILLFYLTTHCKVRLQLQYLEYNGPQKCNKFKRKSVSSCWPWVPMHREYLSSISCGACSEVSSQRLQYSRVTVQLSDWICSDNQRWAVGAYFARHRLSIKSRPRWSKRAVTKVLYHVNLVNSIAKSFPMFDLYCSHGQIFYKAMLEDQEQRNAQVVQIISYVQSQTYEACTCFRRDNLKKLCETEANESYHSCRFGLKSSSMRLSALRRKLSLTEHGRS